MLVFSFDGNTNMLELINIDACIFDLLSIFLFQFATKALCIHVDVLGVPIMVLLYYSCMLVAFSLQLLIGFLFSSDFLLKQNNDSLKVLFVSSELQGGNQ